MTTAELAAAASVAPSVLSRFLRGERSLSLATVDRLGPILGLKRPARPGGPGRRAARRGVGCRVQARCDPRTAPAARTYWRAVIRGCILMVVKKRDASISHRIR
jgi:transcriptional regulator with XRE-family HTH domain